MTKQLNYKNLEKFEDIVKEEPLTISSIIVEGILKNLDTKKRFINILDVHLEEEDTILNFTADSSEFINTLNQNLKTYIEYEEYERCEEIKQAINLLKHK